VKTATILSLSLDTQRAVSREGDLTADYDGRRRLAKTSPLSEAKIGYLGDVDWHEKIEREETKNNECLKALRNPISRISLNHLSMTVRQINCNFINAVNSGVKYLNGELAITAAGRAKQTRVSFVASENAVDSLNRHCI
jgi:hypothetical protein